MGWMLEQMTALTDGQRGAAHPLSPAFHAVSHSALAQGRVTGVHDAANALELAPTGQTRRDDSSPRVDRPVGRADAAAGLRRPAHRLARSTSLGAPDPLPVGVH